MRFLPDPPTGRITENPPIHLEIALILTRYPFIHKDSVLFVWERVIGERVIVEQSTRTTTHPDQKHDERAEISENLPDHNSPITHDDNLGFNT